MRLREDFRTLNGPEKAALLILSVGEENAASEIDQMIDINQVEGRVRASSLKKIGEIVERHPEEAVNIMRSWMFQES